MRVSYVNRNNGNTAIHYVTDDHAAKTNAFEISASRETLYETAAFVDAFPLTRTCFTYQNSIYEQMKDREALAGIKYVLYVELTFKNITGKMQEIDLTNYSLFINNSYHNGIDPFLLEELNQASGFSLKPGHSYTVKMAYGIHRKNIAPKRYQKLLSQNFSIMLTGYPHIQRLRLTHIASAKADKEATILLQNLTAPRKSKVSTLPNTKVGTILELGDYYVDNGIKIQADSVSFADKDIPALLKKIGPDENAASGLESSLEHNYMAQDGTLTYYGDASGYDCQLAIVTLLLKNDTNLPVRINLCPYLYSHAGDESREPHYTHIENLQHAINSTDYTLDAYSQGSMTLLYVFAEQKGKPKIWDAENKPLYLNFSVMAPGSANPEKGIAGEGKFLRIQ